MKLSEEIKERINIIAPVNPNGTLELERILPKVEKLEQQNKAFQEQYNTSGKIINKLKQQIEDMKGCIICNYKRIENKLIEYNLIEKE